MREGSAARASGCAPAVDQQSFAARIQTSRSFKCKSEGSRASVVTGIPKSKMQRMIDMVSSSPKMIPVKSFATATFKAALENQSMNPL